jgi:hypothetical protein
MLNFMSSSRYEVMQGLVQRADPRKTLKNVPLGVIPCGSGNGLAKSVLRDAGEAYGIAPAAFVVLKGKPLPLDINMYESATQRYVGGKRGEERRGEERKREEKRREEKRGEEKRREEQRRKERRREEGRGEEKRGEEKRREEGRRAEMCRVYTAL